MRPESFTQSGFVLLIIGFILFAAGAGLLAQQILCNTSFNSCNTSSVENALRSVSMLLLLLFGVPLIVVGAIFTAGGHMTQHLRPVEHYEDPVPAQPIRVCTKCGRQVDSQLDSVLVAETSCQSDKWVARAMSMNARVDQPRARE